MVEPPVFRDQGVESVVVETVQDLSDPVRRGEGHLGNLGHVHGLGQGHHHLGPSPSHHRPRRAPHDLELEQRQIYRKESATLHLRRRDKASERLGRWVRMTCSAPTGCLLRVTGKHRPTSDRQEPANRFRAKENPKCRPKFVDNRSVGRYTAKHDRPNQSAEAPEDAFGGF